MDEPFKHTAGEIEAVALSLYQDHSANDGMKARWQAADTNRNFWRRAAIRMLNECAAKFLVAEDHHEAD